MQLPHLAARLYGTPLLINRSKLDVILSVLGERIDWPGTDTLVSHPGARSPGARSPYACFCLASGMGGTCYGAVKPNHRLDTRLRPYQAYYCQHWASSKCQIDYKSEQWKRLTEVFRIIQNWCHLTDGSSIRTLGHVSRQQKKNSSKILKRVINLIKVVGDS